MINVPAFTILLLVLFNNALPDASHTYIQGGIDVIAASDESKPVLGGELSLWRLKNFSDFLDGTLEGEGISFGFENKSRDALISMLYSRVGYAYNEEPDFLPMPILCVIGGGSIGPILKLENGSGISNAGMNLSWWNYFGIPGGISLELKTFWYEKPIFNLSFFYRVGMPTSWWIFPIN